MRTCVRVASCRSRASLHFEAIFRAERSSIGGFGGPLSSPLPLSRRSVSLDAATTAVVVFAAVFTSVVAAGVAVFFDIPPPPSLPAFSTHTLTLCLLPLHPHLLRRSRALRCIVCVRVARLVLRRSVTTRTVALVVVVPERVPGARLLVSGSSSSSRSSSRSVTTRVVEYQC